MFKLIRKIRSFFDSIDDKTKDIKLLIETFEESREDGVLDINEIIELLHQIFDILKSIFPRLRK